MRRCLILLVAVAAGTLPAAVRAQPVSGPYIAGGFGVNLRAPQGFSVPTLPPDCPGGSCAQGTAGPNPPPAASARPNYGNLGPETKGSAIGSAGWGFGNGLRVEVEGAARGGR